MFLHKVIKLNKLNRIRLISSKSSTKVSADVFGINDVTSEDIKGTKLNVDKEKIDQKYSYINNLNKLDNLEEEIRYPHATIRLDKLNKPKYHGQFDEDNERIKFDIESVERLVNQNNDESDQNELNKNESSKSDQNLNAESVKEFNQKVKLSSLIKELSKKMIQKQQQEQHEIEEQNLVNLDDNNEEKHPRTYNKPFRPKIDISNVNTDDFEPIRQIYSKNKLVFNANYSILSTRFRFADQWADWIERDIEFANSPLAKLFESQRMVINPIIEEPTQMKLKDSYSPLKKFQEIESELKECRDEELTQMNQSKTMKKELNLKTLFDQFTNNQQSSKEKDLSDDENEDEVTEKQKNLLSEITALDYLRKIKNKEVDVNNVQLKKIIDKKVDNKDNITFKREKLIFDSKGYKIYKNQVFNLYALNNPDRALYLESEIIFNNLGIVAVNKPYGLICPGDKDKFFEDKGKKPVELISFLKDFAHLIAMQDKKDGKENTFEDLNNPILYPIYRLDRNCTGIYILAKNKETTRIVHNIFKERQVKIFYYAITKNVPSLEKASIDIPIEQDLNDKYERMLLKPAVEGDYKVLVKASKHADKAVTNYKILKSHKSAAYLELNPLTSVRHQMRVHLGYGLRTPILGDHLYDQPSKVDYQKLPLDMLLNLNIRPTKTMHIPMHLHCKLMILNRFGKNGKDIFLKADLPNFFKENLKSLKLN